MRRGFLNMFPDPTVGNTGSSFTDQQIYGTNKDDKNNIKNKASENSNEKVSVFSNYDGNKDAKVNYKEGTSLFTQVDLSQNANQYQVTTEGVDQSDVIKLANNKFNAADAFKKIAKGFVTQGNILAKVTVDNGADAGKRQNAINQSAKQLDQQVYNEVKQAQVGFNADLIKQYTEALQNAEATLTKDKSATQGMDDGNDQTGKKGELKEFENAQNTNSIKTAYSQYDKNQDTKVNYNEMDKTGVVKYNNKLSQTPIDAAVKDAIKGTKFNNINQAASDLFTNKANTMDINAGKVDIKFDEGDDQAKMDKKIGAAIDKLDKNVKNQATKFNQKINDEVFQKFTEIMANIQSQVQLKNIGKLDGDVNVSALNNDDLTKVDNAKFAQQRSADGITTDMNPASNTTHVNTDSNNRAAKNKSQNQFTTGDITWQTPTQPASGNNITDGVFNFVNGMLSPTSADSTDESGAADGNNKKLDLRGSKSAAEVASRVLTNQGVENPKGNALQDFTKALIRQNPNIFEQGNGKVKPNIKENEWNNIKMPKFDDEMKNKFKQDVK